MSVATLWRGRFRLRQPMSQGSGVRCELRRTSMPGAYRATVIRATIPGTPCIPGTDDHYPAPVFGSHSI